MKIKEKWNVFGLLIPLALSFWSMYVSMTTQSSTFGVLAIMLAWQAGWSVKLTVEINNTINKNNQSL